MENVQNICNISCYSCSIHKEQNVLKMFENKVFRIYLFNDVVSSSDKVASTLGGKIRLRVSLPRP